MPMKMVLVGLLLLGNVALAILPVPQKGASTVKLAAPKSSISGYFVNFNFDNKTFQKVDDCRGYVLNNPKLSYAETTRMLRNHFFLEYGEALCASFGGICKNKCVPLMVNGRTK